MNCWILAFILFFTSLNAYEHEVAIAAVFRNEADWLEEWIDYHHKIGVEHFYLYNHYSDDNFEDVLWPYVQAGLVDVLQCENVPHPKSQFLAYKDAISKHKNDVKWLAIIDIDEFIVPHTTNDIREFLRNYEEYAGVVVNWQLFGTSNVYRLKKGESMLKTLTWKFPTNFDSKWNTNRFVKTIIRPERIDENANTKHCGVHIFMPIKEYDIVNSYQVPQLITSKSPMIVVDHIQLNHYWMRTYEWLYKNKIMRRNKNYGEEFSVPFLHWMFSESQKEEDLSIQRFIE